MIDFVKNKQEFEDYRSRFLRLFNSDKEIENNIFNNELKYYLAFDFDYIFDNSFFDTLVMFLISIKSEKIIFYTINPSPENYFLSFNKYNVFSFSTSTDFNEFEDILYKEPDNNVIDSIGYSSNDIALFSSNSDEWAIAGSRDLEVAIIGFKTQDMKEYFSSFFTSFNPCLPIKEYIKDLDDSIGFNENQWTYYNRIIDSYTE
ncbi:hypothetical protein EG339_06560 [Chryseobacterium bernardetii]|uniref:Uncharacterized protein n=1 Tax=Chryseobacterium bernardetii TaxID=1241978 RepID=A0A3G6T8W9_9FLAO|nr:hypothetical protein [Chryseobacterium bernardetii]AZB24293.1 hypothetical protein EG339_06560 [Chryseobacterium bernardetii]